MLRKFAMVTTLAAAVLSSISGNTVQAWCHYNNI